MSISRLKGLLRPFDEDAESVWSPRSRTEATAENVNVGGSLHRTLNRLEPRLAMAHDRPRVVIQIDSSIHLVKEGPLSAEIRISDL
jgi:hypothetical protein